MKEVLITTSYYPPEIGAASNRISHLAEALAQKGFKVTVLTPLPNYPTGRIFKGYRNKFIHKSTINSVNVIRLWIYANNSNNRLLRLLSMMSYSVSLVLFYLFNRIPKRVIVQSPPLLVAFTSMFFLRKNKRILILNVSDLWPRAGKELGAIRKGWLFNVLLKMEAYNYRTANLVLGQSKEIAEHIDKSIPGKPILVYRNYPVFNYDFHCENHDSSSNKIQLFYAGLLGIAQAVLEVCKGLDYSNIEFHIYGDGAEKEEIVNYINTNKHLPLYYHGNLEREKLHNQILKHDLALIPLKRRIYGSVPSKIFEYSRLGIPIIYFGGGEGENLVSQYNLGMVVEAGDLNRLNTVLNNLDTKVLSQESREHIYNTANKYFIIDNQVNQLIEYL